MFRGVIWNTVERTSTSRMRKWSDMERAIAPISHLLYHGGITVRDWFSDMLLTALSISMVTSTDSAMVMGLGLVKMPQSMLGSILVHGEPPGGSTDGSGSDVTTDSDVTEEQPA